MANLESLSISEVNSGLELWLELKLDAVSKCKTQEELSLHLCHMILAQMTCLLAISQSPRAGASTAICLLQGRQAQGPCIGVRCPTRNGSC